MEGTMTFGPAAGAFSNVTAGDNMNIDCTLNYSSPQLAYFNLSQLWPPVSHPCPLMPDAGMSALQRQVLASAHFFFCSGYDYFLSGRGKLHSDNISRRRLHNHWPFYF